MYYEKLYDFISDTEDLLDNKVLTQEELIRVFSKAIKEELLAQRAERVIEDPLVKE